MVVISRTAAWARVGIAVAVAVVALLARIPLWPLLGDRMPYLTLYPAVVLASWWGGLTSGLACVAVGGVGAHLFFHDPLLEVGFADPIDAASLGVFVVLSSAMSWLVHVRQDALRDTLAALESQRRARDEAERVSAELRRSESLVRAQSSTLEQVLRGAPLPEVLDALCRCIERLSRAPSRAIVMLCDERCARLEVAAAPSAPRSWLEHLEDLPASEDQGCAGAAAHRGARVVASDVATDPLWRSLRDAALAHGVRAAWSTPIRTSRGGLVGVLSVHHDAPREPHPDDVVLVDALVSAAGIAIEQRRYEEALVESARRKDEFLAMLGHELRNPLAPIVHAAALLRLRAERDGRPVPREVEAIERQSRHLARIVDDLLDVARIARGRLTIRHQRTDLRAVVASSVESVRPAASAAGVELELAIDARDDLSLRGDPDRLAQALTNVLGNAIKYSTRGGVVRLDVCRKDDEITLRVTDAGRGVEPGLLPKIFDLFVQGSQGIERGEGGLGVGLALVRSIVEAHGGTARAESRGPGTGTTIALTVPVAPPAELPGESVLRGPTQRSP